MEALDWSPPGLRWLQGNVLLKLPTHLHNALHKYARVIDDLCRCLSEKHSFFADNDDTENIQLCRAVKPGSGKSI